MKPLYDEPIENASFVGEGLTGATGDSPARNGIRRSATPRRRTAPPLRTTGCLNEPESPCRYRLSDFLVRRVLAHRCTSQRIGFTRFKEGPQAHRPLRFVWKNNFDPWAAPNFREAQVFTYLFGFQVARIWATEAGGVPWNYTPSALILVRQRLGATSLPSRSPSRNSLILARLEPLCPARRIGSFRSISFSRVFAPPLQQARVVLERCARGSHWNTIRA